MHRYSRKCQITKNTECWASVLDPSSQTILSQLLNCPQDSSSPACFLYFSILISILRLYNLAPQSVDCLMGKAGLSPLIFSRSSSQVLCVSFSQPAPGSGLSHDCGFPITPDLYPNQHSPVPSSFIRIDRNSTRKGLIFFFLFLGFQRGHSGWWAPEVHNPIVDLWEAQ